jgi:transcriptional regulator with XRE-family HTH domain
MEARRNPALAARAQAIAKARARSGSEGTSRRLGTGGCRRPLEPSETPYLLALGIRLRELRRDSGLTQAQLAEAAELSCRHIERLEAGNRRTRRSTLARIAAALGDPLLGNQLADLAGPALAPESGFAERIARRRARRARKRARERERETAAERRQVLEKLDALARGVLRSG